MICFVTDTSSFEAQYSTHIYVDTLTCAAYFYIFSIFLALSKSFKNISYSNSNLYQCIFPAVGFCCYFFYFIAAHSFNTNNFSTVHSRYYDVGYFDILQYYINIPVPTT